MHVPAERCSVNKGSIEFAIMNDTAHDVRVAWIDFDGQRDTRPERQNDMLSSGSGCGMGMDKGHPLAFWRMDNGEEVACVCFTTEGPHSLQAAIDLCAGHARAALSCCSFVTTLPDPEARYSEGKRCGFTDTQNISHPDNLRLLPCATVGLEFERVTVVRLEPQTLEVAEVESDWGSGPDIQGDVPTK